MKKSFKNVMTCISGLLLSAACALLGVGNAYKPVAQTIPEALGMEMNGAVLLTEETKYLSNQPYITKHDKGYETGSGEQGYALKKGGEPTPYVSFFVDTLGEGGSVYKDDNDYYGYDAYGFIAGSGDPIYRYNQETDEEEIVGYNSVAIKIKYNFDKTTDLAGADGKKWDISEDTWKSSINGMESVGVVGHGAVIVQKFVPTDEKDYPETSADWKRLNEYSGEETDGVHTVDFFADYSPAERYGQPFNVYTPLGADLQKGIFVKITVAYELVRDEPEKNWFGKTEHHYKYKDVVEETVFYLCNTSAEVVFNNLYYGNDSGETETPTGENTTSKQQKGGEISNNQGAIDGFRADINGWNYEVTYRYNGSTNVFHCEDGQVFLDPGRYDFTIKTQLGAVRQKTVYVHEKTAEANLKAYFGDSLFTKDSMRVFAPSEVYPVYVKGHTTLQTADETTGLIQRAPLVGKLYCFDEEWEQIERDEDGLPVKGLVATKEAGNHNWSFSNLAPGRYEAVFANNEEFFNGTATGDTYKFVWRFTIVEEGFTPFVNQENLYQQIGFSDYQSKHYVVTLPSKGEGNVLVVFGEETDAYNFACKYLASTVEHVGGEYVFDDVSYAKESVMLEKLREKARGMVSKRYFDATNAMTYLSLEEDIIKPVLGDNPTNDELLEFDSHRGILQKNLAYDVVVWSTQSGAEDNAVGEPYLNDRIYSYIDENGEIVTKRNAVKFLSVAEFESRSVTLHPEGTDLYYDMPYGVGVEDYLVSLGAPSGRYLIIEENEWGVNEYYAVYIRPGDMTSNITVERLYNHNYSSLTLGKLNDGQRIKANNFRITSVTNALDPYGLIKITKEGEETQTYQIDEVGELDVFDAEGNYEILLMDRLGNTITFYFDIHNAEKTYTLTYINDGIEVGSEIAYGGKEFDLPTLETQNKKQVFYGWQDDAGNVYTETYVFTKPQDVQLYAVWHYASVDILVYDGELANKLNNKVGGVQELADLSRQGYVLYGYRYEMEDGTIRIYRKQISSVPNVQTMRLDALWIREETVSEPSAQGTGNSTKLSLVNGGLYEVLSVKKDEIIPLPQLKKQDGLTFVGWLYEYQLSGVIFTDEFSYTDIKKVGVDNDNSIKLTAVWIADSENGKTGAAAGTLGRSLWNGMFGKQAIDSGFTGGFVSVLLAVLLAALFRSGKVRAALRKVRIRKERRAMPMENTLVGAMPARQVTFKQPRQRRRLLCGGLYKAVLAPCICLLLCVTFLFDNSSGLVSAIAKNAQEETQTVAVTDNVYGDGVSARQLQLDAARSTVKASLSANSDEEMSDSEEFLYSNLLVDLLAMGYTDVFTARAVVGANTPETTDDKVVEGIGYTAYVDAYEENGGYIFGAGFIALADEKYITQEDVENGVRIHVAEEEAEYYEYTEFKLTFNQAWGPIHYVAYEHYVHYQVANYVVSYSITPDNGEYVDAYGDVYNYDIGEYCHYVNYGEEFELDAFGLSENVDYEYILQSFRDSIEEQTRQCVDIEVVQADFISIQALNDYIVQGQNESFLGVDAEALMYYEANIEDTQYYVVHADGTVEVLTLPPDPPKKATIWERIWMGVASVAGAIVGVVACAIPGVGPVIGGAMISASLDLFMQTTVMGVPPEDIDWKSVLTSAIIGGVTGAIGAAAGAATSKAVKAAQEAGKLAKKLLIQLGTNVVSGIVAGSATYVIGAAIRGDELDLGDYMKAVGMGVVTGAIACLGGAAIEQVAKKSNALFISLQILSGSIVSVAAYGLSLALTGAEFSWEAFWLAAAMGAATATIMVIGGKIVNKIKTAYQKRQEKVDVNTLRQQDFEENQLKALAEAKNKSLAELKAMSETEFEQYLQSIRADGRETARAQELEFLRCQAEYYEAHGTLPPDLNGNIPTNWGTAQNIPQDDAMWILENGRFPYQKQDGFQYDAHHIYSVEHSIETKEYLKIFDPDNLIIGDRKSQHFELWHNKDWHTRTTYVVGPNNQKIYSINRQEMIDYVKSLMR